MKELKDTLKSMLIVIPIMGGFPDTDEKQFEFFSHYVMPFWPGKIDYLPQGDNLGVIKSMQLAYENSDHDILAYLHNDLYIYEKGWDRRVEEIVRLESKVGLVGFFGAQGVHSNSGRFIVFSNMLEAEIHGGRMVEGYMEVAVLDGMAMFATREMLDVRGGVDTSFVVHHFYDLDLSLESVDRGYRNFIIATPIHHQSGLTANRPLFNDWANRVMQPTSDKDDPPRGQDVMYQMNLQRWKTKWAHKLPWRVGEEWPKT
jgi:hypothetical protein